MNDFGVSSPEALINRINSLLEELATMSSELLEVSQVLQTSLPRLLAEARAGEVLSEDQQYELLRSVERRLKTALRARRATGDLGQLIGVDDPRVALHLVQEWYRAWSAEGATAVGERVRLMTSGRWADVAPWPSQAGARDDLVYFTTGSSYIASVRTGEVEEVWIAARNLLAVAGYEVLVEGREEQGSVWKKWALKGTKKAAKNLVEGSAAAVKDTYVRRPGAQATGELAQASSNLIKAMGDREGVHMFDNLVVGQFLGPNGELRSFSIELNLQTRRAIDSDPSMLAEPATLLSRLRESRNALPPA